MFNCLFACCIGWLAIGCLDDRLLFGWLAYCWVQSDEILCCLNYLTLVFIHFFQFAM